MCIRDSYKGGLELWYSVNGKFEEYIETTDLSKIKNPELVVIPDFDENKFKIFCVGDDGVPGYFYFTHKVTFFPVLDWRKGDRNRGVLIGESEDKKIQVWGWVR